MQRGRQPEDQAGGYRDEKGEPDGAHIDGDRQPDRQVGVRHPSHQQVDSPEGKQHAEDSARRGQQQAFREQLPDQAAATGTHRQADGDFLLAANGPRQEQVRHVGAHNQQYAGTDCQQDGQDRSEDRLRAVGRPDEGQHPQADLPVGVRVGFLQPGGERIGHRLGVCEGDTRLQPGLRVEPVVAAMGEAAEVRHLPMHRHRRPEIAQQAADRAVEGGRHHADDGEGMLVELHTFADDAGIAVEPAPPARFAQHQHRTPALRLLLAREKRPPQDRPHPQHVEIVRGGNLAVDPGGVVAVREAGGRDLRTDDAGKNFFQLPVVLEVRQRDRVPHLIGVAGRHHDHLLLVVGAGQRVEEDRLDPTKHGGGGADAEGE